MAVLTLLSLLTAVTMVNCRIKMLDLLLACAARPVPAKEIEEPNDMEMSCSSETFWFVIVVCSNAFALGCHCFYCFCKHWHNIEGESPAAR